jgi:uncharacterized protein YceK
MRPVILCLLIALLLGGCGNGDSSGDASQGSAGAGRQATTAGAQSDQSGGEARTEERDRKKKGPGSRQSRHADPPIASKRIPGAKGVPPGVPLTKGGDNSIQAFGVEGEDYESAQAYADLRDYSTALRIGDFARACALASSQFREELRELIEQAKPPERREMPEDCAGALEALAGGASKKTLSAIAQAGKLLSFRVRSDGYAYLIFKGEENRAMFIAMAKDEGRWKVNVLKPEPFSATGQGQAGGAQ